MSKGFDVEVKYSVHLTQQDVDDIIGCALEGGINYWCFKAEIADEEYLGEYTSEQVSRGGSVKLYDIESGEKYWLDLEKFLNGFKLWVENGDDRYHAVKDGAVDCCKIDGETADMIIQYALFGEIVYA